MESARDAHRRVVTSLAATAPEVELAGHLMDVVANAQPDQSPQANHQLLHLAAQIAHREQGRSGLAVPREPKLAQPILQGLRSFAEQIGEMLDGQLAAREVVRRRWLGLAVAASSLAVTTPLAVCVLLALGIPTASAGQMVSLVAVTSTSALAIAIVAFRVYQSADETIRRLAEKQLSLAFLDAALNFYDGRPDVAPVLERSFDMFLQHYEAPTPALGAADLLAVRP